MANVDEILNRIDNYCDIKAQNTIIRETATKMKAECLSKIIVEKYGNRIGDITVVANHLLVKGIKFNDTSNWKDYNNYKDGIFISDGFYHQLGLMKIGAYGVQSFATALRYKMGGACGNRDIIFTPTNVYIDLDKSTEVPSTEKDIRNMEKFIEQFEEFETAFYKWVEEITDTKGLLHATMSQAIDEVILNTFINDMPINLKNFIIKIEKI